MDHQDELHQDFSYSADFSYSSGQGYIVKESRSVDDKHSKPLLLHVFYASYRFTYQKYFDVEQCACADESPYHITAETNDKTALIIY